MSHSPKKFAIQLLWMLLLVLHVLAAAIPDNSKWWKCAQHSVQSWENNFTVMTARKDDQQCKWMLFPRWFVINHAMYAVLVKSRTRKKLWCWDILTWTLLDFYVEQTLQLPLGDDTYRMTMMLKGQSPWNSAKGMLQSCTENLWSCPCHFPLIHCLPPILLANVEPT